MKSQQVPSLSPEFLHNLRTPLNLIIGYTDLLSDQAREEGQLGFVPDLQRIQTAGRQLLTLFGMETGLCKEVAFVLPVTPQQSLSKTLTQAVVLVVDDNDMNRDVLSRRLEQDGHTVVMAKNGREALEAIRAQTIDLVLLDIMMPEIDGYETLRQLKADESYRGIPVIMISAVDELDSVVRCIEMGADDYMTKPFEPTLLRARTRACLGRKLTRDREARLNEELARNYEHLQKLESQRDSLTHMIIHDLRTPLSSLISGMQTLPMMDELSPDQQEVIDIALTGGEGLLTLINSLLDVDKMESGSMKLNYMLLDVGELLSSATTQVAQLAEAGKVTLSVEVGPTVPSFEGDEETLRRTLVNLLGNAIKFTPPGGTVTMAVIGGEHGAPLLFSVTDTGEGIPEEELGNIFEKFGQVASRKAGRSMSTGLGLTFSKLVVEAHGGEISVQSRVGEGSTFSFSISVKAGSAFPA
jgi:signal transduction histidine kinase